MMIHVHAKVQGPASRRRFARLRLALRGAFCWVVNCGFGRDRKLSPRCGVIESLRKRGAGSGAEGVSDEKIEVFLSFRDIL